MNKQKFKYNPLYFTETSRNKCWLENLPFWQLFDLLCKQDTTLEFYEVLGIYRHSYHVELQFQSQKSESLARVRQLYEQHWYLCPLELIPDLERKDNLFEPL